MSLFTPLSGLLGGSLVGLSSSILLLGNGDILGASGIISSFIITPKKTLTDPKQQWRVSFLASFLVMVKLYVNFIETDVCHDPLLGYDHNLPIVSPLGYSIAGFLVGFGTRLGNGCTTGHGIAGLARFSKRSFAAVCAFMATGMLSASICGPTCPLGPYIRTGVENLEAAYPTETTTFIGSLLTSLAVGAAIPAFMREVPKADEKGANDETINDYRKLIPAAVSGAIIAAGLAISRMTKSSKIYGFLDLQGIRRGTYDPTLMTVMGGGLIVSMIGYQFVKGHNVVKNSKELTCPLAQKSSCGRFNVPGPGLIDSKLVVGAAIFGLGWGFGGLCPGPALFLAGAGFPHVLSRWWPSFFVGSFLAQKYKDFTAIQPKK